MFRSLGTKPNAYSSMAQAIVCHLTGLEMSVPESMRLDEVETAWKSNSSVNNPAQVEVLVALLFPSSNLRSSAATATLLNQPRPL